MVYFSSWNLFALNHNFINPGDIDSHALFYAGVKNLQIKNCLSSLHGMEDMQIISIHGSA